MFFRVGLLLKLSFIYYYERKSVLFVETRATPGIVHFTVGDFPHSIWQRDHAQNPYIRIFHDHFRHKIQTLIDSSGIFAFFFSVIFVLSPCESETGTKSFPFAPHMSQLSSHFLRGFVWHFPFRIFFVYI